MVRERHQGAVELWWNFIGVVLFAKRQKIGRRKEIIKVVVVAKTAKNI